MSYALAPKLELRPAHPDYQILEHIAAWAAERGITELEQMMDAVMAYELDDTTARQIVDERWPEAMISVRQDAWMVRS
jgi:hypothetical protein